MAGCLFCGGSGKLTREHIIPREISARLRIASPLTPAHGRPLQPAPGAQRFHTSRDVDATITAICQHCNGTFFNALQDNARAFWHPAITGDGIELDGDLKKAVATWAYKTGLLFALSQSPRVQWDARIVQLCRDLRLVSRPPVGARVWLARYDLRDDYPEHVATIRLAELTVRRLGVNYEGSQVLIIIGFMMLIVVFWPSNSPDLIPSEDKAYPATHFMRAWPAYVGHQAWPPHHLFKFAELEPLLAGSGGVDGAGGERGLP